MKRDLEMPREREREKRHLIGARPGKMIREGSGTELQRGHFRRRLGAGGIAGNDCVLNERQLHRSMLFLQIIHHN